MDNTICMHRCQTFIFSILKPADRILRCKCQQLMDYGCCICHKYLMHDASCHDKIGHVVQVFELATMYILNRRKTVCGYGLCVDIWCLDNYIKTRIAWFSSFMFLLYYTRICSVGSKIQFIYSVCIEYESEANWILGFKLMGCIKSGCIIQAKYLQMHFLS